MRIKEIDNLTREIFFRKPKGRIQSIKYSEEINDCLFGKSITFEDDVCNIDELFYNSLAYLSDLEIGGNFSEIISFESLKIDEKQNSFYFCISKNDIIKNDESPEYLIDEIISHIDKKQRKEIGLNAETFEYVIYSFQLKELKEEVIDIKEFMSKMRGSEV